MLHRTMPRRPRIQIPDTTLHVVQRGNNKSPTFFEAEDYQRYLDLLEAAARRYDTRVHAYVLMTNHVHLLMTSSMAGGISRTMQLVGGRYVAALNRRLGRTGTLWEGRFRSSPIDSSRYLLACYRYIERNPVRAGIVPSPCDYRWSSYALNSRGRVSSLVRPHPAFLALGSTPRDRAARYKMLVGEELPEDLLEEIRSGIRKGLRSASDTFRETVGAHLPPRLGTGGRGRPR
jgi:putative transposase